MTLAVGLRAAKSVVLATVTGRSAGLSGRRLGTLLRLDPETSFQGDNVGLSEGWVFLPEAEAELSGVSVCRRKEGLARLPEVGEHFLLLIDRWPQEGPLLDTSGATGQITIDRNGHTHLPDHFKETDPSLEGAEWPELERFITEALASREDRRVATNDVFFDVFFRYED